jgi:hypothetical protein
LCALVVNGDPRKQTASMPIIPSRQMNPMRTKLYSYMFYAPIQHCTECRISGIYFFHCSSLHSTKALAILVPLDVRKAEAASQKAYDRLIIDGERCIIPFVGGGLKQFIVSAD